MKVRIEETFCSRPRPVIHGQVRFTTVEEHVSDRSFVPVHSSRYPKYLYTWLQMRHLRHKASRASIASKVDTEPWNFLNTSQVDRLASLTQYKLCFLLNTSANYA